MKRVSKTNLSLAIALTIASSVGQYAMAGSTLVTSPTGAHITANNGGKFTAGAMTNKVSTIEADTGSTVTIDRAVANIGYGNKAFIRGHVAFVGLECVLCQQTFYARYRCWSRRT